jgi:hypothetical protein
MAKFIRVPVLIAREALLALRDRTISLHYKGFRVLGDFASECAKVIRDLLRISDRDDDQK